MLQLRLKELREKSGLSQASLAKKMNVRQSTIGMWESGKNNPEFANLEKLCEIFSVSMDYLLGRDTPILSEQKKTAPQEDSLNPLDKYYMDLFSQLNEDQQGVVLALIRTLSERK